MDYYEVRLETERLLTRPLTIDDVKAWSEFFEDEEATAFVPAMEGLSSAEIAEFWIEKQLVRYAQKRFGLHGLFLKSTDEFVGLCGLVTQEVDGLPELEVGYHILRKHWGLGLAPEAAKCFLEYAFENQLSDSIISIIDVRNKKSQRVAEKNGLTLEKETEWSGLQVGIYRIAKPGLSV